MRPTVHTEKHIVQLSLAAIASGASLNFLVIESKQAPVAATAADVREGAIVSAIYVEMWGTSDDTAAGSTVHALERRPSGRAAASAAQMGSLNAYDNKKNILHIGMGLIGPNTQYPANLVKGWFKIPKGKQRFGIGDKMSFNMLAQSNGMAVCGFAIYKEQY